MKKKQSKKMNQLKYLFLIPVLLSMLFYTSCSSSRQVTKTVKAIEITKEVEEVEVSIESVSFMKIEKGPTFPGCETGDKDCFSKMVQKHFGRNFDAKLPNSLGLSAGKKRVFIGFKAGQMADAASTNAVYNTYIGYEAGRFLDDGTNNVALGHTAMRSIDADGHNANHSIAIGFEAGFVNEQTA